MLKIVTVVGGSWLIAMSGCQSQNDELLAAIERKDVTSVRLMLEAGVDLNPASGLHDVNKPLAYAAAYGNLEIVQALVEAGADLNGRVAYGDVPLIKADEHGRDEIIEYLIKAGANVNVPNAYGVTPFIGLCGQGKQELARLALKHGGDPDASFEAEVGEGTGTKNFSAFQAAVSNSQEPLVAYLLAEGADPTAQDYMGRTPLELAESKGHREVAQLISQRLDAPNETGP